MESFTVINMTTAASAVLFRSESKGRGFHANERLKNPCNIFREHSSLPQLQRL